MNCLDAKTFASQTKIVLMRTTHPGNVGAVARAMKNMGLHQLTMVKPEFNRLFDQDEAVQRAAGADDLLAGAPIYDSLDEALGDSHILIGTSARNRKMPWPLLNPHDCAQEILRRMTSSDKPVNAAFIFGQEASGLSNEELQRCHYHVHIPSVADFASLNLAMAVQIMVYELRMAFLAINDAENKSTRPLLSPADQGWDEPIASLSEVESFFEHLERTLVQTGFHNPENPRMLMTRLRRLFQRTHLDQMEVNILRGILSSIEKRIPKKI